MIYMGIKSTEKSLKCKKISLLVIDFDMFIRQNRFICCFHRPEFPYTASISLASLISLDICGAARRALAHAHTTQFPFDDDDDDNDPIHRRPEKIFYKEIPIYSEEAAATTATEKTPH